MLVWNLAHKNQYVWYENGEYHFQSYETEIAIYLNECKLLQLNKYQWDASMTTLKHLYMFIEKYAYDTKWYPLFEKSKYKKKMIESLLEKGYIETWY